MRRTNEKYFLWAGFNFEMKQEVQSHRYFPSMGNKLTDQTDPLVTKNLEGDFCAYQRSGLRSETHDKIIKLPSTKKAVSCRLRYWCFEYLGISIQVSFCRLLRQGLHMDKFLLRYFDSVFLKKILRPGKFFIVRGSSRRKGHRSFQMKIICYKKGNNFRGVGSFGQLNSFASCFWKI